jgi:3-oxoacyl-[acyl-carrier protein] reductase
MQIDLKGRTALITGASKGLGFATASLFARSGADVAIVARGQDSLDAARSRLLELAPGAKVVAVPCDVTVPTQIDEAYAQVRSALGPVDILVNNVGGHALGSFLDVTEAMWEHDLDVKLRATIRFTRKAWPEMLERKWGRVVNVLNTLSKAPSAGSCPTSVTRAAQLALTKVLSKEGAPHNVLVNAVLVGLIKSDQIERVLRNVAAGVPEGDPQLLIANRQIPIGRIGEASEFANTVGFLVSDAASYITGTAINIDGGMSAVI